MCSQVSQAGVYTTYTPLANHVTATALMLLYHCCMNVYEAIKQMRVLSKDNIPFSIKYVSLNTTKGVSKGERVVSKCLLRKGLSKDYSDKANVLVPYTDLSDNTNKSFYLPLLLEFNQIIIE